jgi:hypothetical protein
MASRAPKHFTIIISLDASLNFRYNELFSGNDASSLAVINGDLICWILDASIPERDLQIDFGLINPFKIFSNLSLRGEGQVVTPPVNFPSAYPGNRQLKYTVSLGNGFSDDPDVVPVESQLYALGNLALSGDFGLQWVAAQPPYQATILNPADVTKSAGGSKATLTWIWSVNPGDPTPPFNLVFTNPPAGWPAGVTYSTDVNPAITLVLPPGGRTLFTITTTSGDGGNSNVQAKGYLTVTA